MAACRVALASVVLLLLLLCTATTAAGDALHVDNSNSSNSSAVGQRANKWAVIVSASRYFFNYRHTASALTMYHLLRQHGMDDDHIVLFLGDSYACDARNAYPGAIYNTGPTGSDEDSAYFASRRARVWRAGKKGSHHHHHHHHSNNNNNHDGEDDDDEETTEASGRPNLYGCSAQVDYAGDDVDVRRVLQVLQGRYDANTPPTRRLLTDAQSHILVYMVGHSAPSYLKFHDSEFLSSTDLAETFAMMHAQGRYGKLVFLADTCYAVSLCEHLTAPNVLCLASSGVDKESYSHNHDDNLGVSLTSRWMYETQRMLEHTSCTDATRMTAYMTVLLDDADEKEKSELQQQQRRHRGGAAHKSSSGSHSSRDDHDEQGLGSRAARTSALHGSWYEFNYGKARRVVPGPPSVPTHRDVRGDAQAIHTWRVSDFMCGETSAATTKDDGGSSGGVGGDMAGMTAVPIRGDLLDD